MRGTLVLRIIKLREIQKPPTNRYLVHNMIPASDITVVWGKPKSGKTFWVLDLAMRVACGASYRGHTVTQGTVLYCTFEGANMFPTRVKGVAKGLGVEHKDVPFYYSPDRYKFSKTGGADGLIESAREADISPVLVVLDTVNRSLDGSENSDEDMTFYTRCVEDICKAFNCAAILVHHCGVAGDRPRGHTSLTGTCAAQIKLERVSKAPLNAGQPMMIGATVEFMKDGPEGATEYSWLQPVTVRFADGFEDESCYVVEAPKPSSELKGVTPVGRTKKALSILQELIEQSTDDKVTLAEWKSQFELVSRGKKAAALRAFYRAYEALREQGVIKVEGKWVLFAEGAETS